MTDRSQPAPQANDPIGPLPHAPRSAATAPLFSLGQTVATPGALRLLAQFNVLPLDLLSRHIRGDWGDLGSTDRIANNIAVIKGERLLSSYALDGEKRQDPHGPKVWVITEGDRSVTTLLLPSEY